MKKVYLFLAEGAEEVEALAVVDILRRVGIDVSIVSVTGEQIVAGAHGIRVVTDLLIEEADCSEAMMLVLPGGLPGAHHLAEHKGVAEVIRKHYDAGKPLAAICAAPLVFGRMGLLKGLKATCYPGFEGELEGAVYTGTLVEQDGLFITGKGPAAVFEFGYTIAEALVGKEQAEAVRNGMLYNEVVKG